MTPSAEVLLVQLQNLKKRHDRVTAEYQALRATVGDAPTLLADIAEALNDAEEAAAASPVAQPFDPTTRHQQPHSKAPSRAQGPARAEKGLQTALERAVETYWSRRDNQWRTPTPEVLDRVRCVNRKCPRVDRRTLKQMVVGGSTIQFSHCPECGGRLADA